MRLAHTFVQETDGHSGEPWWAIVYPPPGLPDHRAAAKDLWVGWDESAEEGPDEGPPYVGAGSGVPYDWYHDNPATGPYPGFGPTRAEPDPRDLEPSATWEAIRRGSAADPNALLVQPPSLGCSSCVADWPPKIRASMRQPAGPSLTVRSRQVPPQPHMPPVRATLRGLGDMTSPQRWTLIAGGIAVASFVGYEIWKASNPHRAGRKLRSYKGRSFR